MDAKHNKTLISKDMILAGKRFYCMISDLLRLLSTPVHSVQTLLSVIRIDSWIITGDEISSGQKLTILYTGQNPNKNYLIKLAFGNSCHETYLGKKWLWSIKTTAQKNHYDCDLMVTEIYKPFRFLFKNMKCFYVPIWISGEINISADNSSLFRHKNTSLKSDLRKIEKNILNYEVTNNLNELHNFYYNMYAPYLAKVHGNNAITTSYNDMKHEFEKRGSSNEILFITKDEEYIAGMLLISQKKQAKLWSIGVKKGNMDYVKDGVIGALVYFSINYLAEKGFKKFDSGVSRPFLKDGVLQFKKKWNQKVSNKRNLGFLIKILSKTSGAKGFLSNNPFIYENKRRLNGAIFVTNDELLSRNFFTNVNKKYYLRGLSKLVIYRFEEADNRILDTVPSELSNKMITSTADIIV